MSLSTSMYEEKTPEDVSVYNGESKELNKLFEALSKAQSEMETAKTDRTNPFFKSKYADFPSVVRASRPYLTKNGICVIQRTRTTGEDRVFLFTRLCHSSGQWIESSIVVKPTKPDIQSMGSYLTYLKRYLYAAITGVVSSDEDDDGEFAMKDSRSNLQNEKWRDAVKER